MRKSSRSHTPPLQKKHPGPHQNTISRWINNPNLTPLLERMLAMTAKPFRAMECAGIVDSTKMSQMRSAHSRYVEYGDDQRDQADWMKLHVIVGAESMVCLGVLFSGSRGAGTHDINYIFPLVEKARPACDLRYVLADKAYLPEKVVGTLWQAGIQAVIPIKKRVGRHFDETLLRSVPTLRGMVRQTPA
jgi:hypothetical protein